MTPVGSAGPSEVNDGGASLLCLDGAPADEGLLKRWDLFLSLPHAARDNVWDVLRPILARYPDEDIRSQAVRLAKAHEVATEHLGMALQACQLLVSRASERNLDAAAFGGDLLALSGDHPQGEHARDILLQSYAVARQEVRQHLAHETVLSHGKLATGIDWRVDRVVSSSQCRILDLSLPLLTINYQEGSRKERITLQLSNEVVVQLQSFCNTLLAAEADGAPSSAAVGTDHDET